MFDQFKVLRMSLTGGIKDPYLRRQAPVFLVSTALVILIALLGSFMSYAWFENMFAHLRISWLATVIVIFVAMGAAVFSSESASVMLDISSAERRKRMNGLMSFATIVVWICIFSLEIRSNQNGAHVTAENKHDKVKEFSATSVTIAADSTMIAPLRQEIADIRACKVKGYCYQGYLTNDGKARIREIEKAIARKETMLGDAVAADSKNYGELKVEREGEVAATEGSLLLIVYITYPMMFFLGMIREQFVNSVMDEIEKEKKGP